MIARSRPRATYEDVLAAPRHIVAEVLFGVFYTFPRPAAKHARASSHLGGELYGPFNRGRGGPGGWIILDEPELHFGGKDDEDIVVPDLAGWRRERMREVPDVVFFTLAPDWVCEVLSDSTRAIDRSEKMKIYARERVPHLWFVDPIARTLEVFQLVTRKKTKRAKAAATWNLLGVWRDDARVRAEPFDAIELELGSLWK
ncbi:MAG TPA: Uma2 family endonuclease [Polyangiaceae bacterium]